MYELLGDGHFNGIILLVSCSRWVWPCGGIEFLQFCLYHIFVGWSYPIYSPYNSFIGHCLCCYENFDGDVLPQCFF
jgi:hypothetical protein